MRRATGSWADMCTVTRGITQPSGRDVRHWRRTLFVMPTDPLRPAQAEAEPQSPIADAASAKMFPPIVYVPCSPLRPGQNQLSVDLRRTRDGRLALLVYSALDRLVSCCGDRQPWTVIPTVDLERVRLETGYSLIFLDLEIPEDLRRQEED